MNIFFTSGNVLTVLAYYYYFFMPDLNRRPILYYKKKICVVSEEQYHSVKEKKKIFKNRYLIIYLSFFLYTMGIVLSIRSFTNDGQNRLLDAHKYYISNREVN